MSEQWQQRNRPSRLERRYQFRDYDKLRDFLENAAELSERVGYYPDMGFGRDYVNITIYGEDEAAAPDDTRLDFAQQLDVLASGDRH